MTKIYIDDRYFPEEELNHSIASYIDFLYCMDEVFFSYSSIFDAGCRNGHLLNQIKIKHPEVIIGGCDYFKFAIDACPEIIKNDVYIWDLRDPILNLKKYDLVVSMEVAEHIDKDYCNIYLNNLKKLTNKYVIITWSSSGGENNIEFDTHLQHLNPLSKEQYHKVMKDNGFAYEHEKTNKLVEEMQKRSAVYWYWTDSIGVFSI